MSLLPTTPGFFRRGIQTLTGLFRKSEPEPEPSLNDIQQRAEVNKVIIDEKVKKAPENIANLKILSKPVPDIPDVPYFPHDAEAQPVPHVTYPVMTESVPQLNVLEINSLLGNDAVIDNGIARLVESDTTEQAYEQEQTRRFNEELAKITTQSQTEVQYKIGCRHGIEVELGDVLASCSLTRKEVLSLYTSLSDESYSRISKDFGENCSHYAAESVGRVTDSWLPDIKLPIPLLLRGPEATKNQTFFKRTALYLDAFKAYNVFNTPNWRSYKSYENKRTTDELHPPAPFWTMQYEREWREEWANEWSRQWAEKNPSLSPPPPPAPPGLPDPEPFVPAGGPANPGYNFRIKIDPYYYVVGPIVEFENIEGRTLIYVKCYDDNSYTTGIYFWVYLSQSEGKYRVFFKLRANSIIEKGFDYTQGTLVDFRLQGILSRYYNMHYSRGKKHPIKINTLKRVIYFVDNMPYLQSRFLDNFPLPLLMYADNSACCRVFPPPPPYTRDGLGRVKGLVCHYYLIHKKYNAIFHQGFPLVDGEITDYFPGDMNPDGQYCRELIRSGHASIFDDFRKGPVGGAQTFTFPTTEPLIYCFTTSCPKTTLVSFDDLLNVMNYTATIWFQGFQNFTRILGGILSPVLYVIIGAMVERPDFELSSIRDQMLGISASTINSAPLVVRDYKKHSAALMTLGTEDSRPTEPTLYLPASPPARTTGTQSHATRRQHDFVTEIQEQIQRVTDKVKSRFSIVRADIPETVTDDYIKKQLIDFGLLAIKADWLKRKFDDSYEARDSVFPDRVDDTIHEEEQLDGDAKIKKMELYCLCNDDTFLKLPENSYCLDPNTPFLQTLPSRFNETRIDYDNPESGEVNVVVDTLAQQYCMKFSYATTPEEQVKEMYVMIQLSSTIVYTLPAPPTPHTPHNNYNKILFAIDMQKTPIACLPEYRLNETPQGHNRDEYMRIIQTQAGGGKYATTKEQKEAAARKAQAAQSARDARDARDTRDAGVGKDKADSKKTNAIEQRKEDAAKAAEQKRQAEQKAKVVAEQTKILHNLRAVLSTDRTMLSTPKRVSSWGGFFAGKMMEYLFGQYFQLPTLFKLYARWLQVCHAYYTTALIYNYNTSRPCVFFNTTPPEGKSYSFATLFAEKLTKEGFIAPPAPGTAVPQGTLAYVSKRLIEHTAAIKLIGERVTAPFLDYTPEDALSSVASSSVSSDPSTSVSSASSAESDFSPKYLMERSLQSSQELDGSWRPHKGRLGARSRSLSPKLPENPPGIRPGARGGSLTINKSIKRSKTKRKNRKTTRKNGKVNRIIKKYNKKCKTYKRKVNGRKLKGNNCKNNKTMRRYRRVRK